MLRRSPRVLIISASIGGGHVACGNALATAFTDVGAEVSHVDLLEYTALPFRRLYRQAYFDLVRNAPDLVEWLGRRMDRKPSETYTVQKRLRSRVNRLLTYALPATIDRFKPDVLVHTHFLGPEIVAGRMRRRAPLPQVEVITDFFAHSLWLQPRVARYFVATEEVRVHLLSAGVDESRVRVTGIPIDGRFAQLPQRATARQLLGLDQDRDVLLLMAGGLDAPDLVALMKQLRTLTWPLTAVVICGRSTELQRVATAAAAEAPGPVQFKVHGLVDDIPVQMAAADVMVSKPGGMTTSEALAAELPLLLVSPYPLQEEANANVLLENGAALRIDPLSTFNHKLRRLLDDEEHLARMRSAASTLARPTAAADVVQQVLDELVPRANDPARTP